MNHTCAVVDMTGWRVPEANVWAEVCVIANVGAAVEFFLWSQNQWTEMFYQLSGSYLTQQLSKRKEGSAGLFSTESRDVYTVGWPHDKSRQPSEVDANLVALSELRGNNMGELGELCSVWDPEPPAGSSGLATQLKLHIAEPFVTMTTSQGAMPQMLELISSLGGYLSIVFSVFTLVFVRAYPFSDTARLYDARTLIGFSAWGNPPDHDQSVQSVSPDVECIGASGASDQDGARLTEREQPEQTERTVVDAFATKAWQVPSNPGTEN
ncbi:purM [Symbiodinium pilosum]|uniref:PurM protein n=1 Tax=Symbiodinium pilosum TaxID=2952 RepID=A0A812UD07_SYMPI|nr:purM [Symbiodinium pilosum]